MKYIIITITLLISSNFAFSQTNFNPKWEYNWYVMPEWEAKYTPIDYKPEVGTKSVIFEDNRFKKKKVYKFIKEYNDKGKLKAYYEVKDDKKQALFLLERDTIKRTELIKSFHHKKGHQTTELYSEYGERGEFTLRIMKNKKGKVDDKRTWTYNDNGNILSSKYFKNGSDKVIYEWNYEWYDKNQKSKSILKNGKGKILQIWTYDCKQEGEQLEKKRDVKQVCKWDEVDEKYLTEVSETFDERGRTTRYVSKFNISDTSIAQTIQYDHKNRVKRLSEFHGDYDKPTLYIVYHKGKEKYKNIYTYNEQGQEIEYVSYWKGKMTRKSVSTYDENNMLVNMKKYSKKDQLERDVNLKYVL